MMKANTFLLFIAFPVLLNAQVTVKGIVTEQNSGNKPLAGVQIKALGATPEASGSDGLFRLVFTGKKPGDRIIVSEIFKPGFEIVNKDVVNSWLVPGDPELRTRIVMCPEGLIAENTLKYYNISLAGLTKAYDARVASLKQQVEQAQIDRKTYLEQSRDLAEQFERQQAQLEELAEKFARENFDDCNAIHQRAFDAFKLGDIAKAIRVLESVNSKEEIEKALHQKDKGKELIDRSDSIIQQNIRKLMFQGDLYLSEFRFTEAEDAYVTAVKADTTNFANVSKLVRYLMKQTQYYKSQPWEDLAISVARTDEERSNALHLKSVRQTALKRYEEAEVSYKEKIVIDRSIETQLPDINNKLELVESLYGLSFVQLNMNKFQEAISVLAEAITILNDLPSNESSAIDPHLAVCYYRMGQIQKGIRDYEDALSFLHQSLTKFRSLHASDPALYTVYIADALRELALTSREMNNYAQAEIYAKEAVITMREGVKANPAGIIYTSSMLVALHNLAGIQSELKKYAEAEQTFLEALSILKEKDETGSELIQHHNVLILYELGRLEMDVGKYGQAATHFEEALQIKKELAKQDLNLHMDILNVFHLAGRAYMRLENYEKADRCFEESIDFMRELAAKNPDRYNAALATRLSHVSQEYSETNLSKAISYNEEALRILQNAADSSIDRTGMEFASARMSRYMLLAGRFEEAEKYARMYQEYSNNRVHADKLFAHCFLFQGKYDEAEKLYLKISPTVFFRDNTKTYKDIILEDLGKLEKAGVTHPDVEKIRALLAQ